jgi:adenine phosphoribosyltransferase
VESLRALVRDVPDFPEPGIVFRDITPLLADGVAFAAAVRALAEPFRGERIDLVAGIESRGFLLGAPLALEIGAGFVPIRKAGRLPGRTIARAYSLEYGANRLEIHADAVAPGQRVLLVDDVLATGGTARAGLELLEELGGEVVGTAFLIELTALAGRVPLAGRRLVSLLSY